MCDLMSAALVAGGLAAQQVGSRQQQKDRETAGRRVAEAIRQKNNSIDQTNIERQNAIRESLNQFKPEFRQDLRDRAENEITNLIMANMKRSREDGTNKIDISGRINKNDDFLQERARRSKEQLEDMRILASLAGRMQAPGSERLLMNIQNSGFARNDAQIASRQRRLNGLADNRINAAGIVKNNPFAQIMQIGGNAAIGAGAIGLGQAAFAPAATGAGAASTAGNVGGQGAPNIIW